MATKEEFLKALEDGGMARLATENMSYATAYGMVTAVDKFGSEYVIQVGKDGKKSFRKIYDPSNGVHNEVCI